MSTRRAPFFSNYLNASSFNINTTELVLPLHAGHPLYSRDNTAAGTQSTTLPHPVPWPPHHPTRCWASAHYIKIRSFFIFSFFSFNHLSYRPLKSPSPPPSPPCSTQARGRCLQLIATHKSAATATPYSAQETPQCHPTQRAIRRYDTDNDGNQVNDDDVAEGDGSGEVEGDGHGDAEGSGDGDAKDDGDCGGRW
ncbi:hypothetical protein EDB86DRAFT_3076839 [Lactarius hatsudake]|nr:hypothetical protein EDB86DRAFT_3076839 [Lactarius hatsudake]